LISTSLEKVTQPRRNHRLSGCGSAIATRRKPGNFLHICGILHKILETLAQGPFKHKHREYAHSQFLLALSRERDYVEKLNMCDVVHGVLEVQLRVLAHLVPIHLLSNHFLLEVSLRLQQNTSGLSIFIADSGYTEVTTNHFSPLCLRFLVSLFLLLPFPLLLRHFS